MRRRCLPIVLAPLWLAGCAMLGPKPSVQFDPYDDKSPIEQQVEVDRAADLSAYTKYRGEDYRLGPGDRIQITRLNAKPDDPLGTLGTFVMPDGTVFFDLAQGVPAAGKTTTELSAALTEALRPYYKRSEVAVALREVRSSRFFVLGKVWKPALYPLTQPTTLLDAIARAGGLEVVGGTGTSEELADLSRSFLIRDGKPLPIDFEALIRGGDARYNIYVKHGDFIYLPPKSTEEILVLGWVAKPASVGYREGMGLIAAISEVGSYRRNAFLQRVLLIRGRLTKPKVAIVNLDDVIKGKKRDIPLEAGDIIWVPQSPWDRLERYLDIVLGTVAETVAANEGIRIVQGEQSIGVGIQIPIDGSAGSTQPAPLPGQVVP